MFESTQPSFPGYFASFFLHFSLLSYLPYSPPPSRSGADARHEKLRFSHRRPGSFLLYLPFPADPPFSVFRRIASSSFFSEHSWPSLTLPLALVLRPRPLCGYQRARASGSDAFSSSAECSCPLSRRRTDSELQYVKILFLSFPQGPNKPTKPQSNFLLLRANAGR